MVGKGLAYGGKKVQPVYPFRGVILTMVRVALDRPAAVRIRQLTVAWRSRVRL